MVEVTCEAPSPDVAEALLKTGAGQDPSLPFKPQWNLADENTRYLLSFGEVGKEKRDTTFYFHCTDHVPARMFELKGVTTSKCPVCRKLLQPYYSETNM